MEKNKPQKFNQCNNMQENGGKEAKNEELW